MLTYILMVVLGMLVGMAVGLLPVLPIYLGPFLIYFFMNAFPVEHLLIFWICILIGSQFFGSISTITLKIPGEASSLIYLNDISKMTLSERSALLRETAFGSFIATLFAIVLVYFAVTTLNVHEVLFFTSNNFQLIAYTFAILSFTAINRSILVTFFLILFGILLGPRNNYVLPTAWYQLQLFFEGSTLFMVILSMLIIPQLVLYNDSGTGNDKFNRLLKAPTEKLAIAKNTVIGCIAGLIPGPCAELASTVAYRLQSGNKFNKIVAAETANNSAVITLLIPFFALGLPITQSTIIFSNIMDIKMVHIPDVIANPSLVFDGYSVIAGLTLTIFVVSCIYYYLTTRFIDIYATVVNVLHSKMKLLMVLIVVAMIAADMIVSEVSAVNYMMLLSFYAIVGIILEKKSINPIPFMFAMLLGDKLIWTYMQFYSIHFG